MLNYRNRTWDQVPQNYIFPPFWLNAISEQIYVNTHIQFIDGEIIEQSANQ